VGGPEQCSGLTDNAITRTLDARLGPCLTMPKNSGSGLLGSVFGESKTTLRLAGHAPRSHRRRASFGLRPEYFPIRFEGGEQCLGVAFDPITSLQSDPRLTASTPICPPFPSGGYTKPQVKPNVFGGFPRLAFGGFPSFFQWSIALRRVLMASFSTLRIQRELPGNLLLEATYVNRMGRETPGAWATRHCNKFKEAPPGSPFARFCRLQAQGF